MDLEKDLFGLSVADSKGGAHVGIIMGSDSDLPTMKAAAEVLEAFGVSYEISIVSAHRYGHYFSLYIFSSLCGCDTCFLFYDRTPTRMYTYAQSALDRGLKVIIAGAGGAAHLPVSFNFKNQIRIKLYKKRWYLRRGFRDREWSLLSHLFQSLEFPS
jgi:hypothetical protein